MEDNTQIARRLAELDTAALSDALDRLGIEGQAIGISATAGLSELVGRAFTVRMLPAGTRGGSVGDYIDDVSPGHVVVIDNQGRLDQTVGRHLDLGGIPNRHRRHCDRRRLPLHRKGSRAPIPDIRPRQHHADRQGPGLSGGL